MMDRICQFINNDFADPGEALRGLFTVAGGSIDLPAAAPGQYVRVIGSRFNDGIYQTPLSGLTDETFEGEIRLMRVPRAVRDLAQEIAAWDARYGEAGLSPYAEESFNGYHYKKAQQTRRVGSQSVTQTDAPTWQRVFAERLRRWRRI